MKYQNNNTFRIILMFFALLFLGSICVSTAHAQNENYSFVTKWGSSGQIIDFSDRLNTTSVEL